MHPGRNTPSPCTHLGCSTPSPCLRLRLALCARLQRLLVLLRFQECLAQPHQAPGCFSEQACRACQAGACSAGMGTCYEEQRRAREGGAQQFRDMGSCPRDEATAYARERRPQHVGERGGHSICTQRVMHVSWCVGML